MALFPLARHNYNLRATINIAQKSKKIFICPFFLFIFNIRRALSVNQTKSEHISDNRSHGYNG